MLSSSPQRQGQTSFDSTILPILMIRTEGRTVDWTLGTINWDKPNPLSNFITLGSDPEYAPFPGLDQRFSMSMFCSFRSGRGSTGFMASIRKKDGQGYCIVTNLSVF